MGKGERLRNVFARPQAGLAAVQLLAAAVWGYAWWAGGGKSLFFPRKWGVLEAGGIYRSGQMNANMPFLVDELVRPGLLPEALAELPVFGR